MAKATFATMYLTIDVGNTQTKALTFDNGRKAGKLVSGTSDMDFILDLINGHADRHIAISSVVQLDQKVKDRLVQLKALIVDGQTPLPITSNYATPKTLGIDRICAAVAAQAHFPDNSVLAIDMGTCITYEVVTANGVYVGGNISPGLHMRFRALNSFTSGLPLISPKAFDDRDIGSDTETAIRAGVQQGILYELEGTIAAQKELYPDLKVVGTGGDLALFANALKTPIFADPFLVLRGLHEIQLHNL